LAQQRVKTKNSDVTIYFLLVLSFAVPGESEIGCLFDEMKNLVEPIERSATDG
jgi:hypothetical protein